MLRLPAQVDGQPRIERGEQLAVIEGLSRVVDFAGQGHAFADWSVATYGPGASDARVALVILKAAADDQGQAEFATTPILISAREHLGRSAGPAQAFTYGGVAYNCSARTGGSLCFFEHGTIRGIVMRLRPGGDLRGLSQLSDQVRRSIRG